MPSFVDVAEGTRHSIGVTADGAAYSWGRSSSLGQLGLDANETPSGIPGRVPLPAHVKAKKAFASNGSDSDSGHSAILDNEGKLWMAGCDRWQQLGLGSSNAGSTGYTWKDGKLWQERFLQSSFVIDLMKQNNDECSIRDVALGGDHTLVLSSNKRDVYGFGKAGDGQLGFIGKPFVSAPRKSSILSEDGVAAICAVRNCSSTIDPQGQVKRQVGKCRSKLVSNGITKCVERAKQLGLIEDNEL